MRGSARLGPRRDSVEAPLVDKVCWETVRCKAFVGVILLKIAIFDQFTNRRLVMATESVLGGSFAF
jgi:hypothetical protein